MKKQETKKTNIRNNKQTYFQKTNQRVSFRNKLTRQQIIAAIVTWIICLAIIGAYACYVNFGWSEYVELAPVVGKYLDRIIQSIFSCSIAIVGIKLIRYAFMATMANSKKGKTIASLLASFSKYIIWIVTILFVLSIWGVNTTAIIASASVLSLVIGLGAQSLVSDIISGIFIIFEGDLEVGDIVVIDSFRGTVDTVGVRTTRIMDAGGNLKIINNSNIGSLINLTRANSIASCVIGIEYDAKIEEVEAMLKDELPNATKMIPNIIGNVTYLGVDALADSSVNLKFICKCKEEDRFQVQRDLNRTMKVIFDRHNVNIPFPQVTLSGKVSTGASKK